MSEGTEDLLDGEVSTAEVGVAIRAYEERFQMSSVEFLRRVDAGTTRPAQCSPGCRPHGVPDTFDRTRWQILLRTREELCASL